MPFFISIDSANIIRWLDYKVLFLCYTATFKNASVWFHLYSKTQNSFQVWPSSTAPVTTSRKLCKLSTKRTRVHACHFPSFGLISFLPLQHRSYMVIVKSLKFSAGGDVQREERCYKRSFMFFIKNIRQTENKNEEAPGKIRKG